MIINQDVQSMFHKLYYFKIAFIYALKLDYEDTYSKYEYSCYILDQVLRGVLKLYWI